MSRLFSLVSRAHLHACLCILILLCGTTFAQDDKITLNFVNSDLPSVIKAVGQQTGKNFILDPRVTGTVTIISPQPVSRSELYTIFLAALRSNGFAAIDMGSSVKIVPEADAKIAANPTGEAALRAKGDQIVTYVFQLQNESAAQLVQVLRPLVSPNNFIGAYPNNNTIVITDYAENVRKIQRIVQTVDHPSGVEPEVFTLANASAIDVSNTLQRVMPEFSVPPGVAGAAAKASMAVDARSNSVVVRADNPGIVQRARRLIATLDSASTNASSTQVVYLRNADATRVAESLRGLATNNTPAASAPTSPQTGTGTQGTAAASASTSSPGAASGAATLAVVQAVKETNSLVITAPDHVYRNLRAVIDKLDTPRAQVYIEALIAEVTDNVTGEFGVQWQGLNGLSSNDYRVFGGTNFNTSPSAPNAGASGNILAPTSNILNLTNIGPGLNLGVTNGTITIRDSNGNPVATLLNLGVLVKALDATGTGNVVSMPGTLTLDNEEANFVVGQNIPLVTGNYTVTQSSVNAPFQTIERRDVGLKLKVKPQISENGTVKLTISQELSSVAGTTAGASRDVVLNTRKLDTTAISRDGEIVAVGGLMQDETTNNVDKVPLLGDIPFIGGAFKYQSRKRGKSNLMVFIRPYVLKDAEAAVRFSGERYDFLRTRQRDMQPDDTPVLPSIKGSELPERK